MIYEIPPRQQLMGLLTEPPVPLAVRFAFHGIIWPDESAFTAHGPNGGLGIGTLHKESVEWIDLILRPEWRAPDLGARLRAAKSIVSRQDAFLARYAVDGNRVQIVVTRTFVHVVISPAHDLLPLHVPKVIQDFLRVDPPEAETPWTGEPWSTISIDTFTFGYHRHSSLTCWRDGLNYLTNGQAVKFSVQKVPTRGSDLLDMPKSGSAPTEESERHWFSQAEPAF
jgi:hypothetical protein